MAGSSSFPTSQDNFVEKQDGIDIIQADDVNDAYAGIEATQGHVGNTGASQSNSIDILDFIARVLPTLRLSFNSVTEIDVSIGVGFGLNSGESIRLPRKNTIAGGVDTSVDMDTGAIGNNLDYFIHSVFDATATIMTFVISLSATAPTGITTFQLIGGFSTDGSAQIIETTVWSIAGMRVIQSKNFQTGAVATGTVLMPFDDTIPQNNEGDQYMTLDFRPKSATSKLKIDIITSSSHTVTNPTQTLALFQDSIADALASMICFSSDSSIVRPYNITVTHYVTSASIAKRTYKIRIGSNIAGTLTFNGISGSRIHGGVLASSITITEYEA